MQPTLRLRKALAAAAITALAASACTVQGGSSSGGTTIAAPKLEVTPATCNANAKNHWFRIDASGLGPNYRYNLYLYRASTNTKDPRNALLTLHGKADSAGKVSASLSCRDKVYKAGADVILLQEASSLRWSNRASLWVRR